jgi:hypothetical protein
MSGPKRTPDKLNTIGIVVVGICSAVLVYVTIVALQAFYMGDTSEIQTMADYGGQDTTAKHIRATQMENISKASTPNAGGAEQTYRVPIAVGMKKIVDDAKVDPSNLVPVLGKSSCRTVLPVFGRPKADDRPPPPECGGGAAPAPAPATPDAGSGVQPMPTGGTGPGGGNLPNQGSGTTGPGAGSATKAAGSAEKGNGK